MDHPLNMPTVDEARIDLFQLDVYRVAAENGVEPDDVLWALRLTSSGTLKQLTEWIDWDVLSRALVDDSYKKALIEASKEGP